MAVESAYPPLLPLVGTLASDSRPAPDAAPLLERSKRSPRGACDFRRNSLAVLRLLVSTSVPERGVNVKRLAWRGDFPSLALKKERRLHPHGSSTGAFGGGGW